MSVPTFDSDRLAAIRAGLIERVAARRRRRIPVWAAIAAFALAGAATGGAVSAAALAHSDRPSATITQDMFLGLLRGGHVVGCVRRESHQHHAVPSAARALWLLGHQHHHGVGRDQLWSCICAGGRAGFGARGKHVHDVTGAHQIH